MKNLALRYGLIFGALFPTIGVAFIALSVFTDVNRPLWLGLNQIKGILCFGLCGFAGLLIGRQTGNVKMAALAGMLAGAMGGAVVSAALYIIPYGFIDHVRQYPFEHYSYLNSGATNIREYLLSERGRATVTETSIGLVPVIAPIAALLGAAVAALGGWVGKRKLFKKILPAAAVVLAISIILGLWSDARRFEVPFPTGINSEVNKSFSGSTLPPGSARLDLKDVEQVWVPAGCFRQGADPSKDSDANWYETPERDVCITKGFWLDKYEVTNASYQRFVAEGGYDRREYWSEEGWQWKGERRRPLHPAVV
ncbi:MAG: formylglycine-generating enzyme family protein [Acidobacteria bacterium]|nr:formylglycine-generating enzyme family protein [Acidobacteriota bacterium]